MYIHWKGTNRRLRAYRRELGHLYATAIQRRDLVRARQIYELRRRVHRHLLMREEWLVDDLDAAA